MLHAEVIKFYQLIKPTYSTRKQRPTEREVKRDCPQAVFRLISNKPFAFNCIDNCQRLIPPLTAFKCFKTQWGFHIGAGEVPCCFVRRLKGSYQFNGGVKDKEVSRSGV